MKVTVPRQPRNELPAQHADASGPAPVAMRTSLLMAWGVEYACCLAVLATPPFTDASAEFTLNRRAPAIVHGSRAFRIDHLRYTHV